MAEMTKFTKILIGLAIVGAAIYGLTFLNSNPDVAEKIAPGATVQNHTETTVDGKEVTKVVVGINTWGGFAGAVFFNGGFAASEQSRFYKDYGILVEFKKIDDINGSRAAWKSGDIDVLGFVTVDAFTTEVNGLSDFHPVIVAQIDWSRGGDAVVVRRGINTTADLKGKTIACAPMSPSHSLLLWLLTANDLNWNDVTIVEVADGMASADLFKKGQCDAAVVWSPDDADIVAQIAGSKVLVNTKTASNIIADVWLVKQSTLDKKTEAIDAFVAGSLLGNGEINASKSARAQAAEYLANGFEQKVDFCLTAIENTRLATYGDNLNFFDMTDGFSGVTGEQLYNSSSQKFSRVKLNDGTAVISGTVPSWRQVSTQSVIKRLAIKATGSNAAENAVTFSKPTAALAEVKAISTKKVSITFASGSWTLDDEAKYTIDRTVVDLLKGFGEARARVEGNTDNVGGYDFNKQLSLKRANAVVNYLVEQHHFSKNKFYAIGNGPDKTVADNATESGRAKNRRTDFELIAK